MTIINQHTKGTRKNNKVMLNASAKSCMCRRVSVYVRVFSRGGSSGTEWNGFELGIVAGREQRSLAGWVTGALSVATAAAECQAEHAGQMRGGKL